MGRRVALIEFSDRVRLFGIYCTTGEMLLRSDLFKTADAAAAALRVGEAAGYPPHAVMVTSDGTAEEPVIVRPYWNHDDPDLAADAFWSTASRTQRVLTGPVSEEQYLDFVAKNGQRERVST